MKILYYSVHQVLEYDEAKLLREIGHKVVCLGANSPKGASQSFRLPIVFDQEETDLYDTYEELGGDYFSSRENVIPENFAKLFDIFIVMHDVEIIQKYWGRLSDTVVVWRTIGQGVDVFESVLQPYRMDGLKIVRYSPVENEIPNSLGQDAIIRFYKDPNVYGSWVGSDKRALTFSNQYKQRYPDDASDFQKISDEVPSILGGISNDSFHNSIGLQSFDEQLDLYRTCGAYLYASGSSIPYTLNFIEAWMTGIPIVVLAAQERMGKYYEIPSLITHEVNGLLCENVDQAIAKLQLLLSNRETATRIGAKGRASAIEIFGKERAIKEWTAFLTKVIG